MVSHPNRSRTNRRCDWIIVPREFVAHGAPSYAMSGHPSFETEEAARDHIQAEIGRLNATVPQTADGGDYLACQVAKWEGMTVIHRDSLRERTHDEARELRHRWPQFYEAP